MTLEIELTIDKKQIMVGQDALCTYKVTNAGTQALRMVDPVHSDLMPIWRLVEKTTGDRETFRKTPRGGSLLLPLPLFEPGQSATRQVRLFDYVALPGPGEFEISIEYEWNDGAGSSRSNPVSLQVEPSSPRYATMVSHSGGMGDWFLLAWIDTANAPGELFLGHLGVRGVPKIQGARKVEKISPSAQPHLSVPANGGEAQHHWVAWLEDDSVRGFRVDKGLQKDGREIRRSKLPEVATEIIPPLLPVGETSGDEDAAVVLCQTDASGRSNLQIGVIEPKGNFAPGPALPISGGGVVWGRCVALSSGERRIYVIASETPEGADSPRLTLQCVSWLVGSGELVVLGEATVGGGLLSADLSLNQVDGVNGAVLTLPSGAASSQLLLQPWSHLSGGKMELSDSTTLSLEPGKSAVRADLGISDRGEIHGAIQMNDGFWMQFTPEEPAPAAILGLPASAKGILEVVMSDLGIPKLIFSHAHLGFRFSTLGGDPCQEAGRRI